MLPRCESRVTTENRKKRRRLARESPGISGTGCLTRQRSNVALAYELRKVFSSSETEMPNEQVSLIYINSSDSFTGTSYLSV